MGKEQVKLRFSRYWLLTCDADKIPLTLRVTG